ncbi:MAG: VWA domain-containing protein [Elusimicrobiaceae bacterium]|nr:VWA domain-containing protein [Elusimicrobiaceae bacterium]
MKKLNKYLPLVLFILFYLLILGSCMFYFLRGKTLANPQYLYLLILWLLVTIWGIILKTGGEVTVKYPLPVGEKLSLDLITILSKYFSLTCVSISLFFAILALARPQKEGKTQPPPTQGIDIMLTLDVSASMNMPDFIAEKAQKAEDLYNRMAAAKETVENFISARTSDRIGLVVFSGAAMLQCPLTLDYFALKEYLGYVYVDMLAGVSGTAIGDAIAVSTQHLKEGIAKSKIIILVTDGENNSGTVDPIAAAKAAAAYGIKVYTILMAGKVSNLPMNIPYRDQLIASYQENTPKMVEAKITLKEISDITGASAYVATDTAGLNDIYAQINVLEKTVYQEVKKLNYEDAYQNLVWLALLFALLAFLGGKFIFIKIP